MGARSEPQPPVFPTKWHFLAAEVLIGVDDDGQILVQHLPDGSPGAGGWVLPMWTDVEVARAAVPAGYDLRRTPARERLAELPDGVAITVYGSAEQGSMHLPADYVGALRPLAVPFPAGSEFRPWLGVPEQTAALIREAVEGIAFVRHVWAVVHSVGDSPYFGCLVYDVPGTPEAQESVVDALHRALEGTSLQELEVAGVQLISVRDVPPELQRALPDLPALAGAGDQ